MDIFEEKWSADVVTKWEPPEGFFKQSAEKIASGLKTASDDLKTAMGRLNFYINRAGKKLSDEDRSKLESAKKKLSKMYEDSAPRMSNILERIEESKDKYSANMVKGAIRDIEKLLNKYASMSDFNKEDLKKLIYGLLIKTSYISDELSILLPFGKDKNKFKKISSDIKNTAFEIK
jgi:coenzyme F420-reducing hydrogenase alpha subunit